MSVSISVFLHFFVTPPTVTWFIDAFHIRWGFPHKEIVTLTHTHTDHIIKDIFSTSIINYIKRRNLLFRVLCRKHSFVHRGDAPRTNHNIVPLFSLFSISAIWNDNEKRHKIIIIITIIMVYYNYLSSYFAERGKFAEHIQIVLKENFMGGLVD